MSCPLLLALPCTTCIADTLPETSPQENVSAAAPPLCRRLVMWVILGRKLTSSSSHSKPHTRIPKPRRQLKQMRHLLCSFSPAPSEPITSLLSLNFLCPSLLPPPAPPAGPYPVVKQEQLSPHCSSSQAENLSTQGSPHDAAAAGHGESPADPLHDAGSHPHELSPSQPS